MSSTAANVPARSALPCGRRRAWTSSATLPASSDGSGTMRRGGAAMSTTLKPSPDDASCNSLFAVARARSQHVVSPVRVAMLKEPSSTRILCVRRLPEAARTALSGKTRAHTFSAQGMTLAMARTRSNTISVRTASRMSCSSRMRLVFFFCAARRKRMAAQVTMR